MLTVPLICAIFILAMTINKPTNFQLKDPLRRRAWIKYALDTRGRNLSDVARDCGVTRHAVYLALVSPYPRIDLALAAELEMHVHELFPERYRADGTRIKKQPGPKPKKTITKNTNNSRRRNIQSARDSEHREAA